MAPATSAISKYGFVGALGLFLLGATNAFVSFTPDVARALDTEQ